MISRRVCGELQFTSLTLSFLAILAFLAAPLSAQDIDYHEVFDERCKSCHGHSGEFSRSTLAIDEGGITGSKGQSLDRFLSNHAGGLELSEIDALLDMFAKQINSEALFQERCIICHDRAHEFARLKLIIRDGILVGRYTGRDIAGFLREHGRLSATEATVITDALATILAGSR